MRSRTSSAGSCTNSTNVSCKWVAYLQMKAHERSALHRQKEAAASRVLLQRHACMS